MAVYLLLKRLLERAAPRSSGGAEPRRGTSADGDEMVQCPYCKVYVPLSRAARKKIGGETLHFCSEECAEKYVKEVVKE